MAPEAVLQAGGYTTDTMAEDMDLTWRIRRIGWRIETDTHAIGYTEAPDSFKPLFKQRFRWAFGTLQSPLEAPPRHRPLRLVRTGNAAVALAFPDPVSGDLAARRSADHLAVDDVIVVGANALPEGVADLPASARSALPRRLHVRLLLRDRADRSRWSPSVSTARTTSCWSGSSGSASSTAS